MKFHHLMATALLFVAMDSRAALIHQFELNGNLNDRLGGDALLGLGGAWDEGAYRFGANKGLGLTTKLGAVYSIDMSFKFDQFYGYNRILDFKDNTTDNGFYAFGDQLGLFPTMSSAGDMTAGVFTRVTVTRDAASKFRIYQDGKLVLTLNDSAGHANFGDNLAYFFRDDTRDNGRAENPPGAVDWIHIYNHALSDAEVLAAGPVPAEVPEPGSLGMMASCLGILGWMSYRRNRKQGKR